MGLDSVELVMSVERRFDIEVPDEIAATLVTVENLHRFVVSELQRLDRQPLDSDAVFAEIRDLICDQLGVEPERVIPEARFVEDLRID
jgi:acyl carrier protein